MWRFSRPCSGLRYSDVVSKRGTAVLEAPEESFVSETKERRRGTVSQDRRLRRDLSEDFADAYEDDDPTAGRRKTGIRVRFGGLPKTKWGRIFAGCGLLVFLGVAGAAFLMARDSLLHDERFVIPSSSSLEFEGNTHVTRAQLLGIFGGDVERNIFTVSLEQRRLELERVPWVAHATVMRLLPNRMRILIQERTPVAFVRQGSHIGLVDTNGVLLDMPVDAKVSDHYSFPVVTGISAGDPLSTRSARMRIFERFTSELDGAGKNESGEKISQELSEVDLSNPEDVKALIPDHSTEILVHFGDEDFLDRYKKFKEHLAEWRTTYPKLSAVDMRYERQVVLETGASGAAGSAAAPAATVDRNVPDTAAAKISETAVKSATKPLEKPSAKTAVPASHNATATVVLVEHKSKTTIVTAKPAAKAPTHVVAKSEVAFDVPSKKKSPPKAKKPVAGVKHPSNATKTSGSGAPAPGAQPHPTQVVHP